MFKRVFAAGLSAALLAGVSSVALAQTVDPMLDDRFKAHVTYLASDELEGRDTGSAGYLLAADYVEKHFTEFGLTPLGNAERTSWRQPINFAEITTQAGQLRVGENTFNQAEHMALYSTNLGAQQIDAEMVFVGHGVVSPTHGIDDYAGLDVRGKVVVVLYDMPQGLPSELSAHLQSSKATAAAERGAIGVLTLLPAQARPAPWSYLMTFLGEPQIKWADAEGRPQSDAKGLKFEGYVSTAMTDALFVGTPLTGEQVQTQGATQRVAGFALPRRMTGSLTTEARMFESPNVIGMLEGSDPVLKNEYVVVMGHLDHEGVDPEQEGEDKIFNGAMDNASGIATMIEVARELSSGERPKRSVIFLAVTGEEKGLLGSNHFAANPTVPLSAIAGVVNLDMPILTFAFEDIIAFGADHSTLGPIVREATSAVGVGLADDPKPEENFFVRSDHYEFVKKGVPSVFLATGPGGPGAAAGDDFLENHYHKVSDEVGLPFDWDAAARFTVVNTSIARTIANGERPRWYADSPFTPLVAQGQPTATRPAN